MLGGKLPRFSVECIELTNIPSEPERGHSLQFCRTRRGAEHVAWEYDHMKSIYYSCGWYGYQVIITELETGAVVFEKGRIFDDERKAL